MINQHCYEHEPLIVFWLAKKRSLLSKYLVFWYGMVHGQAKLKKKNKENDTYFSIKTVGYVFCSHSLVI